MAIIVKDAHSNLWVFTGRKHPGKTLQEVAEEDPSYLRWAYNKASDDLSKEAFYALQDVMEENDIEP